MVKLGQLCFGWLRNWFPQASCRSVHLNNGNMELPTERGSRFIPNFE